MEGCVSPSILMTWPLLQSISQTIFKLFLMLWERMGTHNTKSSETEMCSPKKFTFLWGQSEIKRGEREAQLPSPCSALCQQQLAGHWHGNSSLCFGAETWTFPNRLWPHGCLICTNPQSFQEVSIHQVKWYKTQDKNTSNPITSYFQRRNSIEAHSISLLSSWINMHLV